MALLGLFVVHVLPASAVRGVAFVLHYYDLFFTLEDRLVVVEVGVDHIFNLVVLLFIVYVLKGRGYLLGEGESERELVLPNRHVLTPKREHVVLSSKQTNSFSLVVL